MKEDGLVVRSRAVRENSQELKMEDFDKLLSTPHDPLGAVRTAMRSIRAEVQTKGPPPEDEFAFKPRRAKITKNIIEKLDLRPGTEVLDAGQQRYAEAQLAAEQRRKRGPPY